VSVGEHHSNRHADAKGVNPPLAILCSGARHFSREKRQDCDLHSQT
jgi:hypothetical protein